MSMPTVTVIIPTLPRRSEFLLEALASVQTQTHIPDAIIVAYDYKHEGAAATRNKALAMVTTDYVAFLDDDDALLPDHLWLLIDALESTDSDLAYPWFEDGMHWLSAPWDGERVSPYQRVFGEEQKQWMLNEQNFIPVTSVVRAEIAKCVGGFPQQFEEDYAFLRNLLRAGAKFIHVPVKTWTWRLHDGSTKGQA